MDITSIEKRDGRIVDFKRGKITKAIFKAAYKVGNVDLELDDKLVMEVIIKIHETTLDLSNTEEKKQLLAQIEDIVDSYDVEEAAADSIMSLIEMIEIADNLADEVVERLEKLPGDIPNADTVQDNIEKTLIENGHAKTAKEFILYRNSRDRARNVNDALMKTFEELTFHDAEDVGIKRENANIDGDSAMGNMLRFGSESSKKFNLMEVVPEDIANAHIHGDIHIHDLDFYTLTETCCQIDLKKLFKGGFNTGHGFLREPSEIRSYAALACIAIQANQNDQHGGQSIPAFDHYMAPGVAKTLVKELVRVIYDKYVDDDSETPNWIEEIHKKLNDYREEHELLMNTEGYKFINDLIREYTRLPKDKVEKLVKKAKRYTDKQTYQAMEAFIHNLNSMHSRAGRQTAGMVDVPELWETLGAAV